jgi:lipid A ethanolaminephosphotransferase
MSTNGLDVMGLDESLVVALGRDLKQLTKQNTIIILNQRGSHDPYYERYPPEFEKFKPACRKNLKKCSIQEAINAYDNSIVYSSYNLSRILNLLKNMANQHNTMFLYVSDHGEGIGENGVWYHSMPYEQAGEYVTGIPMLMWFSDNVREEFRINENCLRKKIDSELSHDNIFHSLFGLFGVTSELYNEKLDIFRDCRQENS